MLGLVAEVCLEDASHRVLARHDSPQLSELGLALRADLTHARVNTALEIDASSAVEQAERTLLEILAVLRTLESRTAAELRFWLPPHRRPYDDLDALHHRSATVFGYRLLVDWMTDDGPASHRIRLNDIMVDPKHRRRGVGSAALSDLCHFADANAASISGTFEPDGDMEDAVLRWYERHGFRLKGRAIVRPATMLRSADFDDS